MQFRELDLEGAFVVDLDPHRDERGFFARCFEESAFAARGLATHFPHWNLSRNQQARTLRGMHYAEPPHQEVKLVRCTAGAIFDVIVDLRRDSQSYGAWVGVDLTAENGRALYIPAGCAHGFLTLRDGSDVFYHMGAEFQPQAARGFRWNDPRFEIRWPAEPAVLSARDAAYADFSG